ncbi:zinc finger domain-containing protein [Streptomyces sp. NPDC000880]
MIAALSVLIPSPAADAAHDAAHETHRRFRHGVYSVPCTACHVKAGELCLARRAVHPARRDLYRQDQQATMLVPLLVARTR